MTSLDNTKPIKSRFNSNAEKNNLDRPTRTFLKKEDTQGRSKALIQKTKQHYQRHAKKWNDKEYMRLKNKEGITLEHPKPKRSHGLSRDEQLRIKAKKNVFYQKNTQRVQRIENIRDGLHRSGKNIER